MTMKVLYSKAYKLSEMQCFDGWSDMFAAARDGGLAIDKLQDNDFVFLHDDYSVTLGPKEGRDVIYARASPLWQHFCDETLQFKANLIQSPAA